MHSTRFIAGVLATGLLFGCAAPRAGFHVRRPAEIDVGDIERVAVAAFDGLADSGRLVAAKLTEGIVTGDRFEMFEREKLDDILDERDFSHSDHVDPATANELKLLGVDALIFGVVDVYSVDDQTGVTTVETVLSTGEYETVTETDEDGTVREVEREITETVYVDRTYVIREGTMGVTFRMADVNTGRIAAVTAETAHFSERCWENERHALPGKDVILEDLAAEVCRRFLRQIQPQWVARQVVFEENEHPATDVGVRYAQAGLWDESVQSFHLVVRAHPEDAAARYNLALAHYAGSDYARAEADLMRAIAIEPKDRYIRTLALVRDDGRAEWQVSVRD